MRYRVIERNGLPATLVFSFESKVYCFVRGRSRFLELPVTMESVTLMDLPFSPDEYSLGPIMDYEAPPHPMQEKVAKLGEYLPAEMIEETHINLLKLLREEAGGVTLPHVMS